MHVHSIICWPTGCYALNSYSSVSSVVAVPLSSSFLFILAKIRSGRRSYTLRNYLL